MKIIGRADLSIVRFDAVFFAVLLSFFFQKNIGRGFSYWA
jgi:hypothetical protein